MSEDHGRSAGDDHHPASMDPIELRVQALEKALSAKGLVSPESIESIVATYENDIGPMNGARVVARAWVEPEFKQRLLVDGTAAFAEMGYHSDAPIMVVENRPGLHNVLVCTLCSCYPWAVLGVPPRWYLSSAYRSRVVRDPRAVLEELGLSLDEGIEIHVWDSSAETRYMVLPQRPEGTDGFSQDELRALVSRDGMIGTAQV